MFSSVRLISSPRLFEGARRCITTRNSSMKLSIAASITDKEEFVSLFPGIVKELTDTDCPEAKSHFGKVLRYNVLYGKNTFGLYVAEAYKLLENPEKLTPESVKLANVLGWCAEMLVSFVSILTDVIDSSDSRKGLPCWYKVQDVGLLAINDGFAVENGVFKVLKKWLSNHRSYVPLIEFVHDSAMIMSIGETLKVLYTDRSQIHNFTTETYRKIAKYKTSSLRIPISLAMHLTCKFDGEMHRLANQVIMEIGCFLQSLDDYTSYFKNANTTDIQHGKCTWLAVEALQRANSVQRDIFCHHYGNGEKESVKVISDLYEEIGLREAFSAHEKESCGTIRARIGELPEEIKHEVFYRFFEKLRNVK